MRQCKKKEIQTTESLKSSLTMKENEEKSTLNAYHIERNRLACLEVEEMMKHPSTLEEMREQTRNIMAGVSAEDRGIVFEIAGEGGDIQIIRKRFKKGFVYIYNHNESYFDEELTENKTSRFYDFETPLKLIFKIYPVHCLYITTIHGDYRDIVIKELVWKLKTEKISQDNFCSIEKYEEKLNVKFEFSQVENTWTLKNTQIERLIEEAEKFNIDDETISYLITYPYFTKYFSDIKNGQIGIENLIIGIHFVYGWMPTIFEFKKVNSTETAMFEKAVHILNKAKNGDLLVNTEYETLKELLNGSLVGTSKLLHFINPENYAIWDSRVHRYLRETTKPGTFSYDIGAVANYETYLKYLTEICNYNGFEKLFSPLKEKIERQFRYTISKYRAIELLMFKIGKK